MSLHSKQNLISKKLTYARKTLLGVCELFDEMKIPYHLEGGTLLGIVRDGDLLPWDGDLDISVPIEYTEQIKAMKWQFLKRGKKLSIRKSQLSSGAISKGQISLFKVKPIHEYLIKMILPSYDILVLDIFSKVKDEKYTYWQANGKIMRVDKKYYESFEVIPFLGKDIKVPNHYKEYLTQKYGDWSVPVKQWDCATDELTIIK